MPMLYFSVERSLAEELARRAADESLPLFQVLARLVRDRVQADWPEAWLRVSMQDPILALQAEVNTTHHLEIPDRAYRALKLPPGRADEELHRELAVLSGRGVGFRRLRTHGWSQRCTAWRSRTRSRGEAWHGAAAEDLMDNIDAAGVATRDQHP